MKKIVIPKPINLTAIADRYVKSLPAYFGKPKRHEVFGYLQWGGKEFFLLNDPKPRNLNCTSEDWVYADAKKKLIQEYWLDDKKRIGSWSTTATGKREEDYYAWYYSTTRLPVGFEVVRPMPYLLTGVKGKLRNDKESIWFETGKDGSGCAEDLETCFAYPEFFKPLY